MIEPAKPRNLNISMVHFGGAKMQKPSLEGAYARLARAQKLLNSFHGAELGLFDRDPQSHEQLPMDISISLGEIAYNLRSAVDYLIYELAFLDSGSPQEHTQFPITDDEKPWIEAVKKYRLNHLSPAHVERIKQLQPYQGCEWTRQLRDISNPDKHKKLTFTRVRVDEGYMSRFNHETQKYDTRPYCFAIVLDDGTHVSSTLHRMHSVIQTLLDSFKDEFV